MTFRRIIFLLFILGLAIGIGFAVFGKPLLATQSAVTGQTGLFDPDDRTGVFHGKKTANLYEPPIVQTETNVLGITTRSQKRIEVDLNNQKLYAFEGNKKIFEFLISSGLWGRTPTGDFTIWSKFKYVRMRGGNQLLGTYYDLPNVPYTMFFYNKDVPKSLGFSTHGAYWHDNFGHPMSHGCINMRIDDAKQLYYWADPELGDASSMTATPENPGTRVVIYGTAPEE